MSTIKTLTSNLADDFISYAFDNSSSKLTIESLELRLRAITTNIELESDRLIARFYDGSIYSCNLQKEDNSLKHYVNYLFWGTSF